MRSLIIANLLLLSIVSYAQNLQLGLFGGITQYQGDLSSKAFTTKAAHSVFGINGTYHLTERFSLRASFNYAKLEGNDSYQSKAYLRERNFSFYSTIKEIGVHGVYNIFNQSEVRWTPYVFGGVAVFRFNPYTFDSSGTKHFLKPLSTEGQGLEGYPDRKPYHLTQIALPFGAGVKYTLTPQIELGIEMGVRKLFTDYLDDISKNYVDQNDLLQARGPLAVELSYRADETGVHTGYPEKDAQRGNSDENDWYYFSGLHLTFAIGNGSIFKGNRKKINCPRIDP